jgi:glycosyltransferase involved in cell wall biosynthesis
VVSLPCDLGIGGAVQTGFCIARDESYDIAVQVDGDGQHPPGQVHLLVDAIRQSGCDIAIGSRFLQGSGYQSTKSRRLGIWFFSAWLSAICHTRITDGTSGFRAMNRRAIDLLSRHYAEDYPEVEAIVVAHRAALRIGEVAVEMSARTLQLFQRRFNHLTHRQRFFEGVISDPCALLVLLCPVAGDQTGGSLMKGRQR